MTTTPAFSPLQSNYDEKYQDRPRTDVIGLLDFPFRRVLEIGCGSGATGSEVKRRYPGIYYCGVELDGDAAQAARNALDFVATGNIEEMDLEHYGILRNSFDVVICADVLEHLYDPWKVVTHFHEYLKPGGRVIASIPNVQNVRLIHNLLLGAWTYAGQGLLDATHIRFFTIREIGQLFVRNGYTVEQVLSSCEADMPVGGTFPRDIDIGKAVIKQINADDLQQLYTFQYIIRVRRNDNNGGGV
jgi:SAM-dependent methyltransferase